MKRVLVPVSTPPPKRSSNSANPLGTLFRSKPGLCSAAMSRGIDVDAAGLDGVVVESLAVGGAAKLAHFQAAALDSEIALQTLHHDDAVRDALQLEIVAAFGGPVVKQQDGAVSAGEVAFEGEDLAAVFQRVASEHAQLGQGVKDDALWPGLVHLVEDGGDGVGKLHLRRMEDGVLGFGAEVVLGRHHLEDHERIGSAIHAIRRPV